jgi:hypothetical protein
MAMMSISKLIKLLLTFGIEALLALASCMFEQCTEKFYFGLIEHGELDSLSFCHWQSSFTCKSHCYGLSAMVMITVVQAI